MDLTELWNQHLQGGVVATMRVCSSIIPGNQMLFGEVNVRGTKVLSYVEKPTPRKAKSSIFLDFFMASENNLNLNFRSDIPTGAAP